MGIREERGNWGGGAAWQRYAGELMIFSWGREGVCKEGGVEQGPLRRKSLLRAGGASTQCPSGKIYCEA